MDHLGSLAGVSVARVIIECDLCQRALALDSWCSGCPRELFEPVLLVCKADVNLNNVVGWSGGEHAGESLACSLGYWVLGVCGGEENRHLEEESRSTRITLRIKQSRLPPVSSPPVLHKNSDWKENQRGDNWTDRQTDRERSGVVSSSRAALIIVDGQFQQDKWVTMK